jgi:hypothetical protein
LAAYTTRLPSGEMAGASSKVVGVGGWIAKRASWRGAVAGRVLSIHAAHAASAPTPRTMSAA